ncbi:MAG: MBL fold metallo-hydrolase [Oceanidesulfovibrio sp.]
MRVYFIGVGEAFDEQLPNTSLLALPDSYDADAVLLDCGFTAAAAFFRHAPRLHADSLSAVYLTHMHGDHFMGLPWLLHRLGEDGRTTPLKILGPTEAHATIPAAYELAYPGSLAKLPFSLAFVNVSPGTNITMGDWRFRFAPSIHSQPNLSVRLERKGKVLFYSGDGAPGPGSAQLARGADLIVQESYFLEEERGAAGASGHGSVEGSIRLARDARAARLALVHIARSVRHGRRPELDAMTAAADGVQAFVPQPGYMLTI